MSEKDRTILRILLTRGPAYGIEVMEAALLRGVPVGTHAYTILRRLERSGLVESYEVAVALKERGGRLRRYYRITVAGRALVTTSSYGQPGAR